MNVGEIVGYRVWRVDAGGVLSSYSAKRAWLPNEPMEGNPDAANDQGIWAFKTDEDAKNKMRQVPNSVYGSVDLWGIVHEHESGYRAQYASVASVLGMHPYNKELLNRINIAYGLNEDLSVYNNSKTAIIKSQISSFVSTPNYTISEQIRERTTLIIGLWYIFVLIVPAIFPVFNSQGYSRPSSLWYGCLLIMGPLVIPGTIVNFLNVAGKLSFNKEDSFESSVIILVVLSIIWFIFSLAAFLG